MPLLLSVIGWRTLWKAGVALLVLVLLAMAFALACTVAWLYTWEDTLYQLGWAPPGPVMRGVLSLETALPPAQLRPAGVALPTMPGAGGIVALGNFSWGSGANTFCEVYVEQMTGEGNQGVSADAAAERMASLGLLQQGMPTQPGVVVYFGPSADNEGFGHVGIYLGAGRFRSITTDGLADAPLAGWRAPYLGFTDPTRITSDRFGRVVHPKLGV
jgi:hypothetical protein